MGSLSALLVCPPSVASELASALELRGYAVCRRDSVSDGIQLEATGYRTVVLLSPTPLMCVQARNAQPDALILALRRPTDATVDALLDAGASDVMAYPVDADSLDYRLAVAARARPRTDEQRQVDHASTVGVIAGGIARQVSDPLTSALTSLDLAFSRWQSDPGEAKELLLEAHDSLKQIEIYVRDLNATLHGSLTEPQSADPRAALEFAIALTASEVRQRALLKKEYGPTVAVRGGEERVTQLFLSLLLNAAHAIPAGHSDDNEIRVELYLDERGWVVVDMSDTRPPENAPTATGAPAASGLNRRTHAALAVVQNAVTVMGGEVSFETSRNGTVVRVILPPAVAAPFAFASTEAARGGRRGAPHSSGRILVADDHFAIARSIRRALREHDVTVAPDGRAAMEILSRDSDFDVILCDVMMPNMSGVDVYEALRRNHPGVERRVIFLTAGALTPHARAFLRSVPNTCIEKPFDIRELTELVRSRVLLRRS